MGIQMFLIADPVKEVSEILLSGHSKDMVNLSI